MNIFQLIADGDVASLMDAVITNDAGLEEQKTVGELIAAFPQYAVSLAEYNVGDIMIPEGFLYSIDPEMYQIVLEQSKDAFRVIDAADAEIDPELEAMMPELPAIGRELFWPPKAGPGDCSRQDSTNSAVSAVSAVSAGDGAMFAKDNDF